MRVLSDLTQRQMPAQFSGRRAYVTRAPGFEISPGALLPTRLATERDCQLPGALPAPAPDRRPRPTYRPKDQHPRLPLFVIVDRSSDQALARVRGVATWVADEARKFAVSQGFRPADLIIRLEH